MFLQQTFASVGKVLPAVTAPLVLAELGTDPAWVGVYFLSNQRRGSGGEPIPMRSSRPVGGHGSFAPTLGGGTRRRAHSEDGGDQQEPGVERMRKFFGPLAAEAMGKRPSSVLREAIAKDRASTARDLLGLVQTKEEGETR